MAVEPRRRCQYRKVGGLYLMGGNAGEPCDRLPYPLTICPCCSAGIKQKRGWTWVDVGLLFKGNHADCRDAGGSLCPVCFNPAALGKAGLLWIGQKFYPAVEDFLKEAAELGISRRISVVPRDFKLGESWVLLAHPKACVCPTCAGSGLIPVGPLITNVSDMSSAALDARAQSESAMDRCENCDATGKVPGIFRVFKPHAIEKIVTDEEAKDEAAMEALRKKGITPFVVPANDPDHVGTVYDKEEEPELEEVAAK